MTRLLIKDWRLASLPLTKLFVLFGVLTMVPGYPILMGCFFICLGLFQTFQSMRENNDMLYSTLLPVSRRDIVGARFCFCAIIQGAGLLIMALCTLLRMTLLADASVYRQNALMNANLCFLGYALIIFALFDLIFVAGFFRTAYHVGKPFILFIVAAMAVMLLGETAHHLPGLTWLNAFGSDELGRQLIFLLCCGGISGLLILWAWRSSLHHFEQIDL